MNTSYVQKIRRRLILLVIAAMLALSTSVLPMLLDQAAGTVLTIHVYACQGPGAGC